MFSRANVAQQLFLHGLAACKERSVFWALNHSFQMSCEGQSYCTIYLELFHSCYLWVVATPSGKDLPDSHEVSLEGSSTPRQKNSFQNVEVPLFDFPQGRRYKI